MAHPENAGAEGDRYLVLQRTYQQDLKAKILGALCFIPNITVDVTVELKPVRASESQAANAVTAKSHHASRTQATAEQPNTATALLSSLLGGGHSQAAEPDAAEESNPEPNAKEKVDFAPAMAKVSIGVPMAYFKSIWQKRNASEFGKLPKTPELAALDRIRVEESAKIQRHVAQLLPSPDSLANAAERVTVTTFEDLPVAEPPPPLLSEDLLNWLRQSWGTLGTIGLGFVSLLVLRSIVRRGPPAASVPTPPTVIEQPDASADQPATPVPPPHAKRFHQANPAFHGELSKMVEDDPEAAANVLRNWIGQAG